MIHYKSTETVQRKITPSESDLAIIQQFALAGEEIQPEDLFIGRMSLANDQYDRSHERFPESYLAQFAATIPGKSVMTGHNYELAPEGRIFKAEVLPGFSDGMQGRKELVTSYYLLADSDVVRKVRSGIARDVSIGFNPDVRLCDLCEKDYDGWMKGEDDCCPHVAGHEYEGKLARVTYGGQVEKVEALEGSFVWLGCQYGAQAIAAMRAFSPQAKAAYLDSRAGKGVWQAPFDYERHFNHPPLPVKEFSMPQDIEKAAPSAVEPKASLTPEQERLIELGKAYIEHSQAHVKSRYGAAGQEKTGEVIAATFATATLDQIKAAAAAADEVFNEKFPPSGRGVPMSDSPAPTVVRTFNPFRSPVPRRS